MGLLPSLEKTIVTKPDNQSSMLAVALNSVHKIYCQLMFVNLKTSFATTMKLYEFVSPDDNPPFDRKGKTNLIVDDLAWTNNDAFLLILFNSGALSIIPRLGSALLKVFNPTIVNVDRQDALLF
jgi:hypothetical protein